MAGAGGTKQHARRVPLAEPIDLPLTLWPLRHGRGDPCTRWEAGRWWRATRTPEGPATLALRLASTEAVLVAQAWGPGAQWVLDQAPGVAGADDDVGPWRAMATPDRVVGDLRRRHAGLRMPTTKAVFEALLPAILEQKVTGVEARRSWCDLVGALGEPAPGPEARRLGLMLPPAPDLVASTPYWAMHAFGVPRARAETLRAVGANAARLEETSAMRPERARRRLSTIPGVGPWTAAEVSAVALGDPDAVSIGDFHLPNQVAWALRGRPRGDDEMMLELLEPYRGQRARVLRLINAAGISAPRFGPRGAIRSFRRW
ncbi:MAG: DNA-3-methyladenine glycosylase family protein [Acidimicrobiales bacterium]